MGVLVDYVSPEQLREVNERLKGSPLEVINALAEMPMPANLTPDQERWERRFRLECHKIAMPYTHPRLVAVSHELAPKPSAKIGNYEKPVLEGEQSNDLELARRIAFALAMGAAKAKQAA